MSVTGISSNLGENILKPIRKRNVSGELDVFEATRYFSGFSEAINTIEPRPYYAQKQSTVTTEQRQNRVHPETERQTTQKQRIFTIKPSVSCARGGKLTTFLNSLFRSVGSKKSKLPTAVLAEEEEIPAAGWWRRRRRSSISHLRSTCAAIDTGACDINAPRKSFDGGLAGYSVDKHVISSYEHFKSTISTKSEGLAPVGKQGTNRHVSWLEEKPQSHESLWLGQSVWDKSGTMKNGNDDDGGDVGYESDSSSDLFELNVCEAKACNVKS